MIDEFKGDEFVSLAGGTSPFFFVTSAGVVACVARL